MNSIVVTIHRASPFGYSSVNRNRRYARVCADFSAGIVMPNVEAISGAVSPAKRKCTMARYRSGKSSIARCTVIMWVRCTAISSGPVSYTHLRAHETVLDLVCRLLLEKKKYDQQAHSLP